MYLESPSDRTAFIDDFGMTVTWSRAGEPSDFLAIFDRPTRQVEGLAEIGVLDRQASLLCVEATLPAGATQGDPVSIEGESQAYTCRSIRPDGQGFAAVDLAAAAGE